MHEDDGDLVDLTGGSHGDQGVDLADELGIGNGRGCTIFVKEDENTAWTDSSESQAGFGSFN